MICDVCKSDYLIPLWPNRIWTTAEHTHSQGDWYKCMSCGSDTCDITYDKVKDLYTYTSHPTLNTFQDAVDAMQSNLDWFDHYQPPSKDFLDIGYLEGASLHGMAKKGYSVHGFEVNSKCYLGPHTTIKPEFLASDYPRQYGAIMCREVIEHVPDWVKLLNEVYKALVPDGIFQVQTPQPGIEPHLNIYHVFHLRVFSQYTFKAELAKAGFEILDFRSWTNVQPGQAAICRKITNTV